jgi:cellulose synthase/poly-beta-1,6-N-acetylglucosamine synthase-like glycosyltransferase
MVSLHVPAHNEPPDMVINTLRSLLRLDYPRYGVKFAHLDNWPG